MKNKLFILILIVCNLLTAYVSGEVPPAKVVFQQYMNQAQTFANNFPREKAYLHFDNTSYYVGDTIWFKAYVTLAEQQTFSQISRPLYVELVDQTGHIADKQIIKTEHREKETDNSFFPLPCYPAITRYVPIPAGCLLLMNHSTFRALFLFIN